MNRFCQLCFLFCPDKICTWQPRFSLESNLLSLQCPCGTSAPRVLSRTCRRCPVFSCGAPTTSHWGPGFDPQVWHGHPSRLKTKKNLLIVEFNSKTGHFKPEFLVNILPSWHCIDGSTFNWICLLCIIVLTSQKSENNNCTIVKLRQTARYYGQ